MCAVLAPLLKALDEYMQYHNSSEHLVIDFSSVEQMQKQMMNRLLELIGKFRAELKLLFFSAEGTSLEGYRDRLTKQQTQLGMGISANVEAEIPRNCMSRYRRF